MSTCGAIAVSAHDRPVCTHALPNAHHGWLPTPSVADIGCWHWLRHFLPPSQWYSTDFIQANKSLERSGATISTGAAGDDDEDDEDN